MIELRAHASASAEPVVVSFIIGVGNKQVLLLLVSRVHDLEGVLAYKLVVPVHEHLHIVFVAEVVGGIHNIVCGIVSSLVLNVDDPVLGEVDALHILDSAYHVFVVRVVVDEHDVIVFILLHHDGLHHFDVPIVLDVVVTEDRHAESYLLADVTVLVDLVRFAVLFKLPLLNRVVPGQVPLLFPIRCSEHMVYAEL